MAFGASHQLEVRRSTDRRHHVQLPHVSNPEDIIKAYVEIGLGEVELMSNHCEALAGAPSVGFGGPWRPASRSSSGREPRAGRG